MLRVMPLDPASTRLADAIRGLRVEQDLSQEEVAIDAGITPGSLSRIERAQSNPTWTTVERIAESLGVSLVDLAAAVEHY
jgi:transcriptional regulator with XRE-family HTH domain